MSQPSWTSVASAEFSQSKQECHHRRESKGSSGSAMNGNYRDREAHEELGKSREGSTGHVSAAALAARRHPDLVSNLNLGGSQGDECIYESPSTQIYCSVDTEGRHGPSDPSHPIKVAIKLLFDPEPEEDDLAALFNEYNILMTKLANCNGVRRAIKHGKQDGFQAILLEWADGVSLSQWIASRTAMRCRLLDKVTLARHICVALAEVHKSGVVHRKISADNIIVDCHPLQSGGTDEGLLGGTSQSSLRYSVKLIDLGDAEAVPETGGTVAVDDDIFFCDDLAALGVVLGQLFGVGDDGEESRQPQHVPRSIIRLLDNLHYPSDQGAIFAGTYSSVKELIKDIDNMLDEPESYLFDPHLSEEVMSMLDEEGSDGGNRSDNVDNGDMSENSSVSALDDASTEESPSTKSAASVTTGAERLVSSNASLDGVGESKDDTQGGVEGLLVAGCSALTFVGTAGSGTASSIGPLVLEHATKLVRALQKSKRGDGGGNTYGIEQDMVENLAAEGRYNFVWLTKSDALAKSLAGLSDVIEPGGWFLAIYFGKTDDDATTSSAASPNAIMSRLRSFVGMDGIPRDDGRVAALLDPSGVFDTSTYKSKSVGDINVCVVQRDKE